MYKKIQAGVLLAFAMVLSGMAWAGEHKFLTPGEWIVGLGYDDVIDGEDDAPVLMAELRSETFWSVANFDFKLGISAEGDTDGDLWGGLGPVVVYDFSDHLRSYISIMPGAYHHGDGNDLGHGLEFRSQIGMDYTVYKDWRLGMSFEHKSNASIGDDNPGVETLFLTVGRKF